MIRLHVNQNYKELEPVFSKIPSGGIKPTRVYCNRHNYVYQIRVGDRLFVVKRYHQPTLFNRIMNTFFRKDRSRRNYEDAIGLLFLGIPTAKPIAYIREYRCGIYRYGYLVTEYLPCKRIDKMYGELETDEERGELLKSYIRFYSRIVGLGILHADYNPGNILVSRTDKGYRFYLIDINRIRFNQKLTKTQVVRGYQQLGIEPTHSGRELTYSFTLS